jgi:hypothetical protein
MTWLNLTDIGNAGRLIALHGARFFIRGLVAEAGK